MSPCSNCGRELPFGALYCPDCGARAVDYAVSRSDVSPSHFNTGITATSQPQTTVAADDAGLPAPPPPSPERKRSSFAGRRSLTLTIVVALAVLLVGVAFEAGMLGSGGAASPAVNSASDPLTGQQLYGAYKTNQSHAEASYTNKTIYIQDSLDFGVGLDSAGHYFSSIDSGSVILIWRDQAQIGRLSQGEVVLAKCSVAGTQTLRGTGYVLYLQDCDLVRVQSGTASSQSVSVANL